MLRKYEKLATWINGVSFVALLGVMGFIVLAKHRLDSDVLFKLAGLFKGTGYELAIHPGDPIYATVLTQDEIRRIRRERGPVF